MTFEIVSGDRQDMKLEFLRAPDTCPFNYTLADKSAHRNRNSYTVVLSATPKRELGRSVEHAVGRHTFSKFSFLVTFYSKIY